MVAANTSAEKIRNKLMNGAELNPSQVGEDFGVSTSYLQVVIRDMERAGWRFERRREMVGGKKLVFYKVANDKNAELTQVPVQKVATKRKRSGSNPPAKRSRLPALGVPLLCIGHMLSQESGEVNIILQAEGGSQTWIVSVLNTSS